MQDKMIEFKLSEMHIEKEGLKNFAFKIAIKSIRQQ